MGAANPVRRGDWVGVGAGVSWGSQWGMGCLGCCAPMQKDHNSRTFNKAGSTGSAAVYPCGCLLYARLTALCFLCQARPARHHPFQGPLKLAMPSSHPQASPAQGLQFTNVSCPLTPCPCAPAVSCIPFCFRVRCLLRPSAVLVSGSCGKQGTNYGTNTVRLAGRYLAGCSYCIHGFQWSGEKGAWHQQQWLTLVMVVRLPAGTGSH